MYECSYNSSKLKFELYIVNYVLISMGFVPHQWPPFIGPWHPHTY